MASFSPMRRWRSFTARSLVKFSRDLAGNAELLDNREAVVDIDHPRPTLVALVAGHGREPGRILAQGLVFDGGHPDDFGAPDVGAFTQKRQGVSS